MANAFGIKVLAIFLLVSFCSSREVYPEGLWPMTSLADFSAEN